MYKQKYQQKNQFDEHRWEHDEYDNYYKKDRISSQNSGSNPSQEYSYNKQQRYEQNRRNTRQRQYQNKENKYVPSYQMGNFNKSDDSGTSFHSVNKEVSRLEDDTTDIDNKINPTQSHQTSGDEQNFLIDVILHFPETDERVQINQVPYQFQCEQLDSVINTFSEKHQLDQLTILSIKIMILKKHNHLDNEQLKNFQKGYLDQFIQLINKPL